MLEKYDPETAKKVCGKLKAKYEKDFNHELIIKKYNKLKLEHPEFDERKLLEEVFSNISKDFAFPETMSRSIGRKYTVNQCSYIKDNTCFNEGNEHYQKECPYKDEDKHPMCDFTDDLNKIEFKRKEEDWGDEVLVDISLFLNNEEIGGISYTYIKESSEIEKGYTDVQIENFDVKPEYQGQGYGALILKKALKEIDEKDWTIELGATFTRILAGGKGLNREALISFYKRYGFKGASEKEIEWFEKEGMSLDKDPKKQITMFRMKGKGKGWHGEPERHSKARKTGKADLIEDVKVKICDDCKKEKKLYYQKICEECYQKRVKNYIKVYDFKEDILIKKPVFIFDSVGEAFQFAGDTFDSVNLSEDYPVSEYTRGNEKVKAHTRGESKISELFVNIEKIVNKYDLDYVKENKEIIIFDENIDNNIQIRFRNDKILAYFNDDRVSLDIALMRIDGFGLQKSKKTPDEIDSILKEKYHNKIYKEKASELRSIIPKKKTKKKILTLIERDEKWMLKPAKERTIDETTYESPAKKIGKNIFQLADIYTLEDWGDTLESLLVDLKDRYEERKYLNYRLFKREGYVEVWRTYDFTEDAEAISKVKSGIPSGQTRLQKLWEQQKLFERAKRLGKELGVEPLVSPVKSITVPFSITNTETGKTMTGAVVENLEKNTKQLMPVSSSNVRASGQFGTELLVQFYPSKLQPMRTYRYMFETNEQAKEANESLTASGSPGRWVWQMLRGHIAGEAVSPTKLGPSLSPPGQGLPTIGGTSASLVPYKISNRVPVSRVKNFDEILREMKRSTPNPITNPTTGSRIESLVGVRKGLREMQEPNWRRGTGGLPPIGDFIYIGNMNDLEEDYKVRGHWRHLKSGEKVWIKEHERGEGKTQEKKKTEKIPLWKKIKNKRKELHKIAERIENLGSDLSISIEEKSNKHIKLFKKFTKLNREIEALIPTRKKHEQHLESLEDTLQWAKESKEYDKKEIERELKLEEKKGYKPNYTDSEWYMLLEQYQQWDERIEEHKEKIEEAKRKIEKVEEFEKDLFEDKKTIKHVFDITLHKKLKIQKGLIKEYAFATKDRINTINNAFYDLPKNLQDSCRQIRIFEKATDDPTFGSLKSCGGFYNITEETITLGLKTHRKDYGYSNKFLIQSTVHEAVHALDFITLTPYERNETMEFFTLNYERLKNRGEYAATNKLEFLAEGYTKLYTGDHHWFMGLKKGTKRFFQDIMKKYDFIVDFLMKNLNNKINGIKFSYQEGDNHIFGFYRIPEDVSQVEAQEMVDEGKAQFENVDKYIEKEKRGMKL